MSTQASALCNRIIREDVLDPLERLLARRLRRDAVLHDFGPGGLPHMLVMLLSSPVRTAMLSDGIAYTGRE